MRKIYVSIVFGLIASALASAQNLNPQVQVTNDYKTNMGEVDKQSVKIEIPDSLSKFKTKVDYSVFSTDYKGAYDFTPYEIQMVPEMKRAAANKLFVRAGAGYAFHPVLQAVYTPFSTGVNRLWLHQDFRGYAGDYKALGDSPWYKGYDFAEKFGVAGRWNAKNFALDYGVGYKGVFTKDYLTSGNFNDFSVNAGMRSAAKSLLQYKAGLDLGFGMDKYSALDGLNHPSIAFEGEIEPVSDLSVDFLVAAKMRMDIYSGDRYSNMFTASLIPQALFELEPVSFRAGVSLSPGKTGLEIYPHIVAVADVLDQQIYASITGGQYALGYTDLKLADHWFNPLYTSKLKQSREMVNCKLGVRGSFFSHLQYDISGGFSSQEDVPMPALIASGGERPECRLYYADYNMWYVDVLAAWKSERFDIDANLKVRHTNGPLPENYLDLPLFSYGVTALYNLGHRIYAGVRVNAATARESTDFKIDSFFDLGFYGEYKFSKLMSFWAQASNLLNQKIALAPTHIQSGIYFSAGICLNLR